MPNKSIPSLHPDLEWLLNMSPDGSNLDAFLNQSKAGEPYRPKGARTEPFSISNVFSSPPEAPVAQRAYDLCPALPDKAGDDLLILPPRAHRGR